MIGRSVAMTEVRTHQRTGRSLPGPSVIGQRLPTPRENLDPL